MKFIQNVLFTPGMILLLMILACIGWFLGGEQKSGYVVRTECSASQIQIYENKAGQEMESKSVSKRIDLNTATEAEIEALEGIGKKKAQSIVAWREKQGPFHAIEELTEVDGIGQGLVEKLSPFITVEERDLESK